MDSGVVTSALGSSRSCRARSAPSVSPLRKPRVQAGARSGSGKASARCVLAASARIGVSHSTDKGGAWRPCIGTPRTRQAASAPSHTA